MNKSLILFLSVILLLSCNNHYTPKPSAFYRLELPEKKFKKSTLDCPFHFEYPNYSEIENRREPCWFNIKYDFCNAILHMSYKEIKGNLTEYINNTHDLAYKHSRVAEGISEQIYSNSNKNLHGIVYDFKGNTATGIQFYLTDSINHFIRGALYFETNINDSIIPINNFLKNDVYHIIESWGWKKHN